jgi:hypothetical protein
MSDKIAEIRERHRDRTEIDQSGGYRLNGFTYHGSLSQSQDDLETALAEVERLHRALYRIAGKVPFADDPWTIARDALKEGK